jgi:glucose/arabinose dehydrogenase
MDEGVVARDVVPTTVDPNLAVRVVVSGLNQPTSMAFTGDDEILVLEKASGRVVQVAFRTIPACTCTGPRARRALTQRTSRTSPSWATGWTGSFGWHFPRRGSATRARSLGTSPMGSLPRTLRWPSGCESRPV